MIQDLKISNFELTREEFVTMAENPQDYPPKDPNKSAAFEYLESLLITLSEKLRVILEPDLPQEDWDEAYKVSVEQIEEGVFLDVAGTPYHLSITEASSAAARELEGLFIVHFDDIVGIEKTPGYKEASQYLEALQRISEDWDD